VSTILPIRLPNCAPSRSPTQAADRGIAYDNQRPQFGVGISVLAARVGGIASP